MPLIRLYNLMLGLDDDARALRRAAASRLELPDSVLKSVSLVKRGVDARERVPIYNCTADVEVAGADGDDIIKRLGDNARVAPTTPPLTVDSKGAREIRGRVVVVGSGPAGAFAAYVLALNGFKPLLIERGPPALERLQQIGRFNARVRDHDPESNALFGEGGAGSFSDG